jgi:Nucleotidyl transferase
MKVSGSGSGRSCILVFAARLGEFRRLRHERVHSRESPRGTAGRPVSALFRCLRTRCPSEVPLEETCLASPRRGRFGVAKVRGGKVVGIEEKPAHPKSNYAATGIYMYDQTVFSKIHTLVPSGRGELEITDVNNMYIKEGTMTSALLEGWWTDAGIFDSLLCATNLVAESRIQNKVEVLAA